jgi:hypothetical protein
LDSALQVSHVFVTLAFPKLATWMLYLPASTFNWKHQARSYLEYRIHASRFPLGHVISLGTCNQWIDSSAADVPATSRSIVSVIDSVCEFLTRCLVPSLQLGYYHTLDWHCSFSWHVYAITSINQIYCRISTSGAQNRQFRRIVRQLKFNARIQSSS